ncbi:hypothetical protein EGI22_20470 [Lacihabitans sp. LS3-19]|nr:hypothetical protein [Lacihabitans sp. LS3-19]
MSPDSLVSTAPKLRFSNINEGVGKILTSDAFGNATWQNLPTSGLWQQTGNYISNTNSGGFWSPYANALPVNADNTSYPPQSPSSGNGTRMAWIPGRSAFQGGTFNLPDGSVRFISDNIGLFSFCYGLNSESRSRGGVAIGEEVIADGTSNTIAFGENVQVLGQRNIGFGFGNQIQDGSSNTIAMGEGIRNTGGEYVNSMGWGLLGSGYGTSIFGTFNSTPTGSLNSWVSTDPLFTIGNGQSNSLRSNALLIQKNGVVNIGISPLVSLVYRLRVGGGIYSSSAIQGNQLRATNLAGVGERDVCTDASGNLIECSSNIPISTQYYNISAMGFQPVIPDASSQFWFRRDLQNGLVYFDSQLKQVDAYAYAPIELPDGALVNEWTFNYKQTGALNTMFIEFVKVGKTNAGPSTILSEISSTSGVGILEITKNLDKGDELIENAKYYYYVRYKKAPSALWQGDSMAVRGVIFKYQK